MINKKKEENFLEYLNELSSKELKELVVKFAPDSFKEESILKYLSDSEYNDISYLLTYDIDDEELIFQPEHFQEKLSKYLVTLKPFINQNTDELFTFLFDLITRIENESKNSYFHDHIYYDDESFFDFDTLASEIMMFINAIEEPLKKIDMFIRLQEISKNLEYVYITYHHLEIKEKHLLVPYFNKDSDLSLYQKIKNFLPFEQKESYLLEKEPYMLVLLYIEENKKGKAIELLEKLIEKQFQLEYIEKLFTLKTLTKNEIREYLIQGIKSRFNSHDFIVKNIKKVDNQKEIEELWEQESCYGYYLYLEEEKRVDEMYLLLDRLDGKYSYRSYRENFLKKYKREYRDEAILFFQDKIDENLTSTGDNYYHIIADTLSELKDIMDDNKFRDKVEQLKSKYKRRKNFIAILNKRF